MKNIKGKIINHNNSFNGEISFKRRIHDIKKINKSIVGPASTITGSFILNSILVEVAGMLKKEKIFPFYISSNMPNANTNNDKLVNKYKKVNPHL